jgi:hypothetical protein
MIQKITLVGLDSKTPIEELVDLVAQVDQKITVELAILYSGRLFSDRPSKRYVSSKFAAKFALASERLPLNVETSLHLSGAAADDFIKGIGEAYDLSWDFNRVKVSFVGEQMGEDELIARVDAEPDHKIILPFNDESAQLCHQLSERPSVSFVSQYIGGVSSWRYPYPIGERFGYAGALSAQNLATELPKISLASSGRALWIEMTSSLRDDTDTFSIERAHASVKAFSVARNMGV